MFALQLRRSLALAGLFFAVLAGTAFTHPFSLWLLAVFALLSLSTLLVYRSDKRAAEQQRSRTPENTLHLLSLCGGWPGALLARPLFRHKTRKQPFVALFWCSVLGNVVVLGTLLFCPQLEGARQWLDAWAHSGQAWLTGLL